SPCGAGREASRRRSFLNGRRSATSRPCPSLPCIGLPCCRTCARLRTFAFRPRSWRRRQEQVPRWRGSQASSEVGYLDWDSCRLHSKVQPATVDSTPPPATRSSGSRGRSSHPPSAVHLAQDGVSDRDRQPSSPKLILHSVPSRVPQTFFDLLQHPEGVLAQVLRDGATDAIRPALCRWCRHTQEPHRERAPLPGPSLVLLHTKDRAVALIVDGYENRTASDKTTPSHYEEDHFIPRELGEPPASRSPCRR